MKNNHHSFFFKFFLVFFLLACSISSFAQERNIHVLGKVLDSTTMQPLAGASAFCTNTSYGSVTNAEGMFFLRLPTGGYDLVVSYTGYNKKTFRISNNDEMPDTLVVLLTQQDRSLEEVAFVASNEVENGWERFGDFFFKQFIGTTPDAGECRIMNPEVLRFFYYKTNKRNRLKVLAKEDLQIMNYHLGYQLRYSLDSFSYDYNNNISQYTGDPLFTAMDSTEDMNTQWAKNRAKTYLGSRLHFMRSYYDSVLSDEGFIVEKLDKKNRGTIIDPYDSTMFMMDSSIAQVYMKGRYRVSYRLVYPDKNFLEEFKLPKDTKMQVTLLDVKDGFAIEENGYFFEQYDVINSGYWAWKKLAEQLPYDYEEEGRSD